MDEVNMGSTDDDLDRELDRELEATDDVLQRSLAQLLSAPADLETRTQSQVTTNLLSRSVLGAGADLLTVGWQTVRLLFVDSDGDGDGDEEVTT